MHSATERQRERDIEREKEKEAAGSNNSWLLAVACWLAGWLCWLGWQHPLAKISFCVKSLKWASAWLGLEQCREPKGELRVESWELVLCCEICECCKCQGKTAAARRSPKKDQEDVEEAAVAAPAAEVGKTRWVRVETRTRTKFVADVVKNWQQMLLNFKRNFTYLSCGAHSLRCSFERSFRQPTSCCSPCPLPLSFYCCSCNAEQTCHRPCLAASSRRLFCVSSSARCLCIFFCCCFLFASAIFNNSSEFRWLVRGEIFELGLWR